MAPEQMPVRTDIHKEAGRVTWRNECTSKIIVVHRWGWTGGALETRVEQLDVWYAVEAASLGGAVSAGCSRAHAAGPGTGRGLRARPRAHWRPEHPGAEQYSHPLHYGRQRGCHRRGVLRQRRRASRDCQRRLRHALHGRGSMDHRAYGLVLGWPHGAVSAQPAEQLLMREDTHSA